MEHEEAVAEAGVPGFVGGGAGGQYGARRGSGGCPAAARHRQNADLRLYQLDRRLAAHLGFQGAAGGLPGLPGGDRGSDGAGHLRHDRRGRGGRVRRRVLPQPELAARGLPGELEVISWHYDDTVRGWAVPTWFAEKYGVKTVQDLNNPQIARLLDRDGDGYGDLLGCEVGWTCHDQINYKLEAYGLTRLYRQIDASEQMINYAIRSALDNGEPVLFF